MIMIFGKLLWNDDISRCFFLFCFFILIFQAVREVKGQKIDQNEKTLSVALHISGIIHHMIVIYGILVWNNDISRHFFHFFKILIFWVVKGLKGQKMVQNEKISCLLCSISQETYIILFWFMVHMWKMIISTRTLFIFSKFWFSGLLEG